VTITFDSQLETALTGMAHASLDGSGGCLKGMRWKREIERPFLPHGAVVLVLLAFLGPSVCCFAGGGAPLLGVCTITLRGGRTLGHSAVSYLCIYLWCVCVG
jgi:hypothetical protein